MIPRIIHYCWFGKEPLSELAKDCIASWKKYCPDYEIKEWNESNFDLNCCDFVKEAYDSKKWAFLSDCARLYIIYNEGGIYLDIDVKLINSLDALLTNVCFLGEEPSGYINTGIGFGAEKHSVIVYELLQEYFGKKFILPDGSYDMTPCPTKNTLPLRKYGYRFSEKDIWKRKFVTIYPPEYFCPLNYETSVMNITDNTIAIHLYNASWHSRLDKMVTRIECCDSKKHPTEYKLRRFISFPFRVINKVEKKGLRKTILFIKNKLK